MGEEDAGAGHPIGPFPENEMTDDIEGAPGAVAFVAVDPDVRKSTQPGIEGGRRVGKKCRGFGQAESFWVRHFSLDARAARRDAAVQDLKPWRIVVS